MALKEVNNEAGLLKGIAAGDDRAFAALFYAYYNQVAEFVQSVTHDAGLTEEIVQDVFTKIWQNREQLVLVEKFTAYLFILTRNHTLNMIRKATAERKERESYERSLQLETEPAEMDKEPRPEYEAWLDRAAVMLPPQQQQVFALRRRGLKNPEIARQMNLSPDSVKKYYQLALRAIAEFVKAQGFISVLLAVYLFSAAVLSVRMFLH